MGISDSISRVADYYSRHGLSSTFRRAGLGLKRALFANRMVVFYCDLRDRNSSAVAIPDSMRIDRVKSEAELNPKDLHEITSFWNPERAHRNIAERFDSGASLWLIRSGENLAGYGWTLQGGTIEQYYFPLGPGDVHLFDFHVFVGYRGRGVNPTLVAYILGNLEKDCSGRAFIEAAEWNQAQLSSLKKTPFRRLGMARTIKILGNKYVKWLAINDSDFGQEISERSQENTENHEKKARARGVA